MYLIESDSLIKFKEPYANKILSTIRLISAWITSNRTCESDLNLSIKFCGVPNYTFDVFVCLSVCDIHIN